MRVLVIGGGGFLGSRTVSALTRLPRTKVVVGRRTRPSERELPFSDRSVAPIIHFDLENPSTFSEMSKFDFVVNVSDSLVAPPTLAIDYALANGITFLEGSAHAGTIDRLMWRTHGPAADPSGWKGRLLLGMGLFPGLSNVLARQLVEWVGNPERLDVVIRLMPLAGGGRGLCELMVRATQDPTLYYENGKRVSAPPLRPGVRLFTGRRTVPTIGVGLPEAHMIHTSLKIPSVATYVTTIPTLPGWFTNPLLRWIPHGSGADKVFVPVFRGYLRMIRTSMFARKAEFVEVNVVTGDGNQLTLRTTDGIQATAYALAAAVSRMAELDPEPGAYLPDELFELGPLMDTVLTLARGDFKLSLHGKLRDPALPPENFGQPKPRERTIPLLGES